MSPWVLILMGSDSDMPVMSEAATALDDVGVPYTITVASAHRTPERTKQIVTDAENDGCAVFVAGAGMAAHLPGVVAAYTTRPVIGVPLASGAMQGTDALHAIVQMPPGIPVATLALVIALIAVRLERRPATDTKTFGYQRAGILAAFVNAGTLVAFTAFIAVEAINRFRHPQQVNTLTMLITAAVALVLNATIT